MIADPVMRLAWLWLEHAERHEGRAVDAYLHGDEDSPDRTATVILRSIAEGLSDAAGHLDWCADRLKGKGDAHGASVAHGHAVTVHESYDAIAGEGIPEDPDD